MVIASVLDLHGAADRLVSAFQRGRVGIASR